MAIYGAGSNWDGTEMCSDFFTRGLFIIGWDRASGRDLQSSLASLKIGDIIYLKAAPPGSRKLRIKGIGIVTRSFVECIQRGEYGNVLPSNWQSFFIRVEWIIQKEFSINIPPNEGRLTNIRAATFYEEPLPFVQEQIVSRVTRAFFA
ncbi:MAG: hypothetical protein NTZ16_11950 [Verrucomicrobia bacterium]|nr:hypothetical protein [Verrucomicrobiota bacterium]